MSGDGRRFAFESMGTRWTVTIWDDLATPVFEELQREVVLWCDTFDRTYSRFIPTSLVWELSRAHGVVAVPKDLIAMLRLYERLNACSNGACTPLVGFALSDLGYDADYTLKRAEVVRPVPALHEALRIVDETHIDLRTSVLLDLGALGKGYAVDCIGEMLDARGIRRWLVDGSGDVRYRGNGVPIRIGLEHPQDATSVIGVLTLTVGALCGSGSNRRAWGAQHHIIDPATLDSPNDILATWVQTETAALADGLATCLFLWPPESFADIGAFEFCMVNDALRVRRSPGFDAELF